ncbi:class D sortase [Bacillus sp. SCS-153A]|uniref:class D sortase n=1 Tax=Rossellomorea sedimentorum TaxID=3115294 RepID=UPI0039064E41
MKKIGNIFILLSLLIAGYVGYEHVNAYFIEKKLLANTEELSRSLRNDIKVVKGEANSITNDVKRERSTKNNAQLTLSIPKIDLTTHVFYGTSTDILKVAVGQLEGSGDLGEIGQNHVILGHRSHTTGKFFNRLDELTKGDTIHFSGRHDETYEVIEKKIILPTQLEVLEAREGKSIVTLITCHPMYSSEKRLVVVAEKVS